MEPSKLELDDWPALEARLGGPDALTASAQAHGALRRRRGVREGACLLRLALMYGPGGQSLRSLSALAAVEGLAELSDVALLNRLKRAADWLEALCQAEQAKVARALAVAAPGRVIRLIDASRIEAPDGSAWRLHLCVAPQQGRMVEAAITPIRHGERLDRLSFQPGEIRIGDRGYPQPDGLRAAREAGADVLVRLTWNSLHLLDSNRRPLNWTRLFSRARRHGALDQAVLVGQPRGAFSPLPLRLVMIRKPPEAAAKARQKARRASQKQQRRRVDPRTLAAADFLILLTSLDATAFPLPQLGALYRVRWQVELTFKRLKSLLHMVQLRARNADLARLWLHAHLLFALILEQTVAELDPIPP